MASQEGESLFSFSEGEKLSISEYQEIFGSDDDQEDFNGTIKMKFNGGIFQRRDFNGIKQ